jgi:hypothetical protein
MKRFIFLATSCLVFLFSSFGQFRVGLKGGVNFSDIIVSNTGDLFTDESFGTRVSFHLGSYMSNSITDQLSWQLEVLFSNKGYSHRVNDQTFNVSLNYLNWPLLLLYQPTRTVEFEIGSEFGYLITGEDIVNSFDLGIDLGLKFNITKKINAGIRYCYGLPFKFQMDESDSNDYDPTYQNTVFQIYAGFNLINELTKK